MPALRWCYLGRVDYAEARKTQTRLALERSQGSCSDLVLFLEHAPVLTIGRRGEGPDLAIPTGAPQAKGAVQVVYTDRGGGITYHGPGQLVAYPVIALRAGGRGVRTFVQAIEQAMCEAAQAFGVFAVTREGFPGAWTVRGEPRKLGAVGLAVRRGVTLHGCSLNVDRRSEAGFRGISPCGLSGVGVSSLESESGVRASLGEVAPILAAALATRLRFDGVDEIGASGGVDLSCCTPADRTPHFARLRA